MIKLRGFFWHEALGIYDGRPNDAIVVDVPFTLFVSSIHWTFWEIWKRLGSKASIKYHFILFPFIL